MGAIFAPSASEPHWLHSARKKVLQEAWKRFGGSLNSFQSLAQLLKLCDRSFTSKHVASIYALARRPQADPKQAASGLQSLRYEEFCEAMVRLALVWQRVSQAGGGDRSRWPPQPQPGHPVKQRVIATR